MAAKALLNPYKEGAGVYESVVGVVAQNPVDSTTICRLLRSPNRASETRYGKLICFLRIRTDFQRRLRIG
jgi:hypothetical protein